MKAGNVRFFMVGNFISVLFFRRIDSVRFSHPPGIHLFSSVLLGHGTYFHYALCTIEFEPELHSVVHSQIQRSAVGLAVVPALEAPSHAVSYAVAAEHDDGSLAVLFLECWFNDFCTMFLVGFANASFCALFGGDWTSRSIVFSATLIGFYLKQVMQKKHLNHYIVFVVSAFIASLVASSALTLETTAEVAIATSVLYLVPGVPLLNGVIDIVEGHSLTGCARLIQALLLVLCIAVGLSGTLILVKNGLL